MSNPYNFSGIQFPGIDEPPAEEAPAAPEEAATQETSEAPTEEVEEAAPPAEPTIALTKEELRDLFRDSARELAKNLKPEPPTPKDEFDPNTYWDVKKDDPNKGAALHAKLEKFFESKIAPMHNRVQAAEAALEFVLAAKADDPEFAAIKDQAIKLYQAGEVNSLKAAIKLAKSSARSAATAPTEAQRRTNKKMSAAVPVPPKTAVSPTSKTGKEPERKYRNRRDILRDPEVQKAAALVRRQSNGGGDY